jgi:DNA-binding MarR family transcriptional regulator
MKLCYLGLVGNWSFFTNHGRVLLSIADNPEIRLRDIATDLGITERHAYAIVNDLTDAGYVLKEREGRRNRYQVQSHLALPELPDREQAIGDVLDVLTIRREKRRSTRRAKH